MSTTFVQKAFGERCHHKAMTQRYSQWSVPWVVDNPVGDPVAIPWEAPQESMRSVVRGDPGRTPWSNSLAIQDDFFSRATTSHGKQNLSWADSNQLGFYAGQPYMTPGVTPGLGGGWRALESGPPEDSQEMLGCSLLQKFCDAYPTTRACQGLAKCPRR